MKTKRLSSHLNNEGFSLVELIVVIAIMVVLIAVAIVSASMVDSSYVKEMEQGVEDYYAMTRTKSMSVSAKEWYMELTTESGEYTIKMCKVVEEAVEGGTSELKTVEVDKDVYNDKIKVVFNDGVSERELSSSAPLRIYFDAASGKVKKVTIDGIEQDISSGIGRIGISRNDYDIVMKLFYNTGKIERE